MNSREKGKRGERQWRDELRAHGYTARRGQQYSGSPESPDVICDELDWLHFEVKAVERLNIEDAMDQARRDSRSGNHLTPALSDRAGLATSGGGAGSQGGQVPLVVHRRSFRGWLVTMDAETFFGFLGGTLPPEKQSSETTNDGKRENE